MSGSFFVKTAALLVALGTYRTAAAADELGALLSDIERWASLGGAAPSRLTESVAERLEKHGTNVSGFVLKRLSDTSLSEDSLAVYVGVLGLTRDTNAVPPLIHFLQQTPSETLQDGCIGSLAFIGGEQAISFLVNRVGAETNSDRRFNLLNCLAQTRHASALPKLVEVLECDPRTDYWRPVFVFGKMGDTAVPLLISKIGDTNRNVRFNAIQVLGQWEFAPEALEPLRTQFWREEDPEIRDLICSSVTQIALGRDFTNFLEEVTAKAKDQELIERARQALEGFPKAKAKFLALKKTRRPSARSFQREYDLLFRSVGLKGDYEKLTQSSALADEPALKRLRERILQRNSDEAFYDYKKVSELIWQNRFFAELK